MLCKQCKPDQTPRSAASDLSLHYLPVLGINGLTCPNFEGKMRGMGYIAFGSFDLSLLLIINEVSTLGA